MVTVLYGRQIQTNPVLFSPYYSKFFTFFLFLFVRFHFPRTIFPGVIMTKCCCTHFRRHRYVLRSPRFLSLAFQQVQAASSCSLTTSNYYLNHPHTKQNLKLHHTPLASLRPKQMSHFHVEVQRTTTRWYVASLWAVCSSVTDRDKMSGCANTQNSVSQRRKGYVTLTYNSGFRGNYVNECA